MALPLTIHPMISFLGSEEGINGVLLPSLYSPSDSINVWADRFGRIRKIPGAANLNATKIVTNAGSEDVYITAMFCYIPLGSTYTSQHILVCASGVTTGVQELWKSTDNGATWAYLATLSTTGVLYDFAQYRSTLYFTQIGAAVRKYNGTAVSSVGLTQSPTPTATGTSTGINLNGTYRWKLVSMIGTERQQGSVASAAAQFDGQACALSWTADADTNVTGYEVYRTTGTGGIYYFVGAVEGRTTTSFSDNVADRVILANRALQEQGDAPTTGHYYVEVHKERMWYGRTSTNPTRVYYSDAGRPESVGALSYIELNDVDAQTSPLTGLTGNYEGKLIAWTEKGIWAVSGTAAVVNGVTDLYVRRTSAAVGTVSHRTVVRVPAGAVFRDAQGRLQETSKPTLAYMSPYGDFRLFDGSTDSVMSSLEPVSTGSAHWTSLAHAVHDQERQMIWWTYGNALTTTVAWNYALGTWHHWNQQGMASNCVIRTASKQQMVLGGGSTDNVGRVMEMFTGETNQLGNTFVGRWVTNTLYGRFGEDADGREGPLPALHLMKRWRWVQALMAAGATYNVRVRAYRANQAASETPFVSKTLALTASPNRQSMADKTQLKDATGRFMHDIGIRLSVEDGASPSGPPWVLESLVFAYNVLQGTKRDRGN